MSALDQWRDELAAWAIPPEIVARASEPPWGFPVELFAAEDTPGDSPSRTRALEALPEGGTVIDVGCGGGAAALALADRAGLVVGVDSAPGMLAEFAAAADRRGLTHREVDGDWPGAADQVPEADVVVCHNVLYNVADLAPFVAALTAAARHRVVVELTAEHPMVASRPLWQHFHGIDRPTGPSADLAADALRELGITVELERWSRPPRAVPRSAYVALNRCRLCLPADRDPEVDRLMGPTDQARDVVTLRWDTTA
jgi:SAM-dependent methyltransferase